MPTVLVDSNVILDIFTADPAWSEWSSRALRDAADNNRVVINPIVYSEISVRFSRIEDIDAALPSVLEREPIPYEAAFLAGKVFSTYRRRSGNKTTPLPDFFIGAHAAVSGYALLTRDTARYRTYFPSLKLIAPP
jgi:predicted nucleic acid-binding protein